MTQLAVANIFAEDMEALARFYSDLLGFPEIVDHRGPIYRALDAGGNTVLGIHDHEAYGLLKIDGEAPVGRVRSMLTFEVDSQPDVESLSAKAETLGGTVIKPAYQTPYGSLQAVVRDPEGNVFRLNAF